MPIKTVPIAGDNQGSIFMSSNPVQERRSKHIDICYHYVRECIEEKKVAIFFIDEVSNPTDLFTKNLREIKFMSFRKQLGLVFYDDFTHRMTGSLAYASFHRDAVLREGEC